ncbi:MAG TPA: serine/threonine-protein kinase [Candidatus Xenobia bacterium]|jgi:serine/threonine protein kinase
MLEQGETVGGRYKVERSLGQGGMGSVYQALQLALEKPFALKEMIIEIPNPAVRAAAIEQFKTEAQILHELDHPGLPRLYDFFEDRGRQYLVMELIRGQTLDKVVSERSVTEVEMLRWLREICEVLRYLHTHVPPVLFRDLKPSNIMLTQEGHIKLIDFGIAKVVDAPDEAALTRTGIRGMCTPGYAAPEQYGGGTDEKTDIYALGATIYSLFTLRVPPSSVDLASGREQLPPLQSLRPDISDMTAQAIASMMRLNLRERPQDIHQVIEALGFNRTTAAMEPIPQTQSRYWLGPSLTRLVPGAEPTVKKKKKRPTWLVGASLAALVAGAAGWRMSHQPAKAAAIAPPSASSTAKLVIVATPDDVVLTDNQEKRGYVGPGIPIDFSNGHHVLAFGRVGYVSETREIDVKGGQALVAGKSSEDLHVSLKRKIHLMGTAHAQVSVDGTRRGELPRDVELTEGPHMVEANRAGFYRWKRRVMVASDRPAEVQIELQQIPVPSHVARYPHVYRRRPASTRHHRGSWWGPVHIPL